MVVAKTHPGRPVGVLLGPAHSLGQDGGGAVEMPDLEMLGVLMLPFQAGARPEHPDPQAAVVAARHHGRR
jgi:hypothetical protein